MSNKGETNNSFLLWIVEDMDENWLSFFNGMIAGIPISVMFMFQSWGKTIIEHWFFIIHIVTFLLTAVLVVILFLFTIKKIEIKNTSEKEYEHWVSTSRTTSSKMQKSIHNRNCKKSLPAFRFLLISIIVLGILSSVSIILLWILNSFR